MPDSIVPQYQNAEYILQQLAFEINEDWRESWPVSQAAFSSDNLPFLEEKYIRQSCEWLRMSEETTAAFVHAAGAYRENELLERLAWHYHYSWFCAPADFKQTPHPMPPKEMGEAAAMLYGLVNLSGLPHIRKIHKERNIPEDITIDTLSDLERWARKYRQRSGSWGFSETGWLRLHFSGRIYKLGRLQFEMNSFFPDYHVFRNGQTAQVVILAGDGMRFDHNGQCAGQSNPEGWEASFSDDGEFIRGYLISPRGHATRKQIELTKKDWLKILGKGDPALSIHIPEAGPMDHGACGDSLRQAMEFFPKHHPEFHYKAFMCFSWLLDPQFEQYLDAKSNIVRFLQEFYLFSLAAFNPIQSFANIFDNHTGPLDEAPQRTSLQRATRKHLESGGVWRVGGCVAFPEDLNWGTQTYRKMGLEDLQNR